IRVVVSRRTLRTGELNRPLLVFLALMVCSLAYGVGTHGSLTIALWEVRSLFLAGLLALVIPTVLERREHGEHLINLIIGAVVLLSIATIWRRFAILGSLSSRELDLVFAHESPVFMNLVIILLLARLIWPASSGQRAMALLIP